MTTEVAVTVGDGYSVVIGEELLEECGERLRPLTRASQAGVVTDANVAEVYLERLMRSLQSAGFAASAVVVPAGETSKSWDTAGTVLEGLAQARLDRTDVVVALGGGVVGDLAGFAAATYLRGVGFVQLPTTLLAQVDSSVGGKTGVDLTAGKNLAGAFKQPLLVLADTSTLSTLSDVEWKSGLAEVAKVAVLAGEEPLEWLEESSSRLVAREVTAVDEAIRRSVEFKARIVAEDERESGLRECLNYGHTFGHAVEAVAGYGVVPHGVAVAEGIRFAALLAVDAIGASETHAERQARLLDSLGIPRIEQALDPDALRSAMASDKKARGGEPRFVMSEAPGIWRVNTVPEAMLIDHLEAFATGRDGPGPGA